MKAILVLIFVVATGRFVLCAGGAVAAPALDSAATAPSSLVDLWNGKAKWVQEADGIGKEFGFHFVSILSGEATGGDRDLWAYYIDHYTASDGKFKMTIGRARSVDGLKWSDDGMVLDVGAARRAHAAIAPAWDDRLTSFPGAWKDGNTWYLVYEGASEDSALSPGDVGLATSADGLHFVKNSGNPILRHDRSNWERANIGTPSLYRENGTWYLFYHSYDGNVCQICVAIGKSLTSLTRSVANPVLPVTTGAAAATSAVTSWDCGTTGRRSRIVKDGDYYYLAFEGSTAEPYATAKWSSGIARTKDLTGKWEKWAGNPMIPQTAGGMNFDGPELLKIEQTWHLYVRSTTTGGNASARFRLEMKR